MTDAQRGKRRRAAVGSAAGLVAVALILTAILNLWHFDGTIGPGCDWGSRYCDAADYRYMCARFDGPTFDARWQTYCRGGR